MPFYPGAPMTVAVADPPHALVLWQVTSAGKAIDPTGPWGDDHVAWSWAFVLEPVDAATTRLLVPDAGQLPARSQVGTLYVAADGASHADPTTRR